MGINRVVVSGNLTREPDVKRTESGISVMTIGIAVNSRRKNNQTGEWEDVPMFIDCTMFGARAESMSQMLSKGSKVTIEGKLRFNQWEKDGVKRSKHDIIIDEIELMSQKQGGYSDHHSQARKDQAEYVQATYYDDDDLPW